MEIGKNMHYSDQEVLDLLPGLIGSNLFELDIKKTKETLKTSLPWLKDVVIEREFPRKVKIEFTERQAYVIASDVNDYFLMDSEGVVIETFGPEGLSEFSDILVVKRALKYGPALGEKVANKIILSCGQIYRFMEPEIRDNITEARIEKGDFDKISFKTVDFKTIIYGDSEDISEKNAVLIQMLNNLSEQDTNYSIIDISDYQSPVIR